MSDLLTYAAIQEHLTHLTPPRHHQLAAMEEYARQHHFPIIGPASGQLCYLLARLMGARRIFELGSGYGYSTAWFARAVAENDLAAADGQHGEIHHVVWDDALSALARQHLAAMGYAELVRYHVSEAVSALTAIDGAFDIIFNDIDKHAYPDSLAAIEPKLRSGGLLIIDNTLWYGRIFDADDQSPETRGVREVTRLLTTDDRWITTLAPLRDGLLLAVKR